MHEAWGDMTEVVFSGDSLGDNRSGVRELGWFIGVDLWFVCGGDYRCVIRFQRRVVGPLGTNLGIHDCGRSNVEERDVSGVLKSWNAARRGRRR